MGVDVQQVMLSANGIELSGLYAAARDEPPLALIVALHGGGMTARYFHGQLHPSLSILRLGSALGYDVLALDRPGYGASRHATPADSRMSRQAATIWSAVVGSAFARPDIPVLLLGHSFGAMVALHMAAENPTELPLWGIDFSGIGTDYAEAVFSPQPDTDFREFHWGSEANYPAGTFQRVNLPTARIPAEEADEAIRWTDAVAEVVAAVRCPVRITVAEGELNWVNDPADFARMFVNAESTGVDIQPRSGHNISLSWAARAYHLRVIAFFDDCVRLKRYVVEHG